jgi:DNA-binding GntR family transcriptional regulator
MQRAADKGDLDAMSEADMEYHATLVAAADSTRLTRMHNTLLTETRMCLTALEKKYPDPHARVAEHQAIAEALGDGDQERVGKLLISHMEDALERLTGGSGDGEVSSARPGARAIAPPRKCHRSKEGGRLHNVHPAPLAR